jgi:hypothetical protein
MMILHAYFETQAGLNDSDDSRQEFSLRLLDRERFIYGEPVTVPGNTKVHFKIPSNTGY